MRKSLIVLIVCILRNPVTALADGADKVIVGVNTPGVQFMSDQQQDVLIEQLQENGVTTVRIGIGDKYNRFIIEAHRHGIGTVAVVWPVTRAGTQSRPADPSLNLQWAAKRLTDGDPEALRAWLTTQLAPIEAAGVRLSAFEFCNEINGPFFNGDFLPAQATGRVMGLSDLDNPQDPEGQAIAASYRAYLSQLAALKEVRDHSTVNRKTPIVSAGMADGGLPGKRPGQKLDGVSVPATLAFLRRNGIDKLVDGYGIHIYPTGDLHRSAATRTDDLEQDAFALCTADKPCWLTEWGWGNTDQSCPLNDETRAQLIQLERKAFEPFVKQGRLVAALIYMWSSLPGAKGEDPAGIFRCGALTDAGKLALSPMDAPQQRVGLCIECLKIRVGVPLVSRGPAPNIADASFTVIQLPNGKFRGFTSAGTTWAIDGDHPYDMGGAAVGVLKAGPPNTPDSCGQWIVHVELEGKTLYGWDHNETACNYANYSQTHASMVMARSSDYGHTWTIEGTIITGTDQPHDGKETGDSCGNVVRGQDGYDYAYCAHNGGHSWDGGYGFIARAPSSDPGPGKWKKFFSGAWSEPGIGGKSSPIDGGGSAWWNTMGETIGVNWVKGGMRLVASLDRLHFTPILSQPLMLVEPGDWGRKNGLELVAYADLIDAKTGLNQLGDHWLLAYMYLNPGESFDKRYLVFRPVDISWSRSPGEPEVGEMLTHWYDAAHHDHWATIAPVPGNYSAYHLVAQLGYVMTAPDPAKPTVELEECISKWPGQPDRILIQKSVCEKNDYQRLRSAGFVYTTAQPNTQPLYRCYSESEQRHFASNGENCNNVGKREALLGYDLKE